MSRAIHLLVLSATGLACGPEVGSDSGTGGGDTSTVTGADTGSATLSESGTSDDADTTGSATSGTTAAPGPTAEDCFAFQSEEACEAAGCTEWSAARVVSMPTPGACECSEPYDVCLLFEGSVGAGSFPASWVFVSEPETVVELQCDYTSTPVGWTRCEDLAEPPADCGCFNAHAADHCDSQPGTTD